VTVAKADNPYAPVNRFIAPVGQTDTFRFVGSDIALLEPCRDEFCRRVVEYIRSTCPELSAETLASGDLTIRFHDDVPRYVIESPTTGSRSVATTPKPTATPSLPNRCISWQTRRARC
jgi:hypothetical protein